MLLLLQQTLFLLSFLCFLVTPASFLFLPVAVSNPDSHVMTHFSSLFFPFLSTLLSRLKTRFASNQMTKVVRIYFICVCWVFGLRIPDMLHGYIVFVHEGGPACATFISQDCLKTLNIVPGTFWQ